MACAGPTAGPKLEPAPKVESFAGGPRLSLDNRSVDFGSVPYQELKATFQLTNVGDQRLEIKKVDVKTVQGC